MRTEDGSPFGIVERVRRIARSASGGVVAALLVAALAGSALAQDNADCMRCHGDAELVVERGEEELTGFVDLPGYERSAH